MQINRVQSGNRSRLALIRAFGASRLLALACGGVVVACSLGSFTFVPDPVPDHCADHQANADRGESDIDCGGEDCHGCELGQRCNEPTDCAEGLCTLGFCEEPACDNGVKDPDETGVDCGGGSCGPCRDGQPCLDPTDCDSGVCGDDALCASPTCSDGVRNGDEVGVDCGGSFCGEGCGIGTPCKAPTDCQSGRCDESQQICTLNCLRGTDECDGELDEPCETNLLSSSKNCGACGTVCDLPHATTSCSGGICQIDVCEKPWIRCNTDNADGCEINGSDDVDNCGGCGMVCPERHGTPACVNGGCVVDCDDAFGDCDADARTGCETSLNDVNNCGACGKVCPDTEGVPNCVAGKCGHTDCNPGLGDCDGNETCETRLSDDPANCGRCGNVCSVANGSSACVDGECTVKACDAPHEDCNGMLEDGCEADLTSAANCGACGNACAAATPTCVQSAGTYACQARITIPGTAPYAQATAAAGSITFNATPRAGTNRLILLALVSDSSTNGVSNGIEGARPGTVKFGTQSMLAGPSQSGVNSAWSPDLFVYYLPLGDAVTDGAQVQVSITGASGPASVEVVQALQLNGAAQATPIVASVGGTVGAPDPNDPGVSALSLPVATSGSVLYSFFADEFDSRACAVGASGGTCPTWTVSPAAGLTLSETMATPPFEFYPISNPANSAHAHIRGFGLAVTASTAALPGVGSYTLTWSSPNPGRMTHLAVAIAPASSP